VSRILFTFLILFVPAFVRLFDSDLLPLSSLLSPSLSSHILCCCLFGYFLSAPCCCAGGTAAAAAAAHAEKIMYLL